MSTYPKSVTLERIKQSVTTNKGQIARLEDTNALIIFHSPVDYFVRLVEPDNGHTFAVVTSTWPRTASILMRDPLERKCQMINSETYMPKLYSVVSDDGTVSIRAEAVFPVAAGLTNSQIAMVLDSALKELEMALGMLDEAFPDTVLYPEHSGE